MDEHERALLDAINVARVARGLPPLRHDAQLSVAAYEHAVDLSRHPGLMHVGSDGSSIIDRIRRAGYAARLWREVVGWGFGGEIQPAVEWWLNSPDHVGIILDADMTDIGVGYARGTGGWSHYWCVDFGTRETVQPPPPPPPPRPYTSHVPVVIGSPAPPAPVGRFGRGFGLVGWERVHQDENSPVWSAISEMRPDVGRLTRMRIDCL